MTVTEQRLLEALLELEAAVANPATGGAVPALLPHFEKIDRLAAELPATGDPELRHFLARKSYAKARQRLEGRAAARGACGE